MQKKITAERQDRISIDTPYGTIESDSGNHFLDIATVVFIILICALLKFKGALLLKNMFNK
jgi:hypothetical protein